MRNKDLIQQETNTFMQEVVDSINEGDQQKAANAFASMQEHLCQMIEEEFEQYGNVNDIAVLQQRGLRVLTSDESAWYQKFISAAKTGTKQAITNLADAMPVTIIDQVIEDMKKAHPLLGALNIQNAAGATRLVMNAVQMASKMGSWGAVASAITQQLTGQIRTIDITTAKYTAYFIIPKDFVRFNFTFAPMWVDQYIRIILSESVAFGLEDAFLSGNGNNKPIGMMMDTSTSSNGVYSQKTAVAISNWEEDYSNVIAGFEKDENNDDRNVPRVLLVVNPKDAITKVRKAQNMITPAGIIDRINMTWPTEVVSCSKMPENKAVVGIAENYFAAINGGQSGTIEYSDEFQFLDDTRVYTTRVYGQGRPIDNVSFTVLDITNVEAPAFPVKVKGTVKTKEEA